MPIMKSENADYEIFERLFPDMLMPFVERILLQIAKNELGTA
jgi:hypothetical protein